MKIEWKFINGEVSALEVNDDSISGFIIESRKEENNLERKERYHCISLDGVDYKGEDFADYETPELITEQHLDNERIINALNTLTVIQKKRLLMLVSGITVREIARIENKNYRSVYESIEGAKKKFLENF